METATVTKKYLAQNRNDIGLEIESTDGPYIIADGKRYIDFTSGWCVGNLGWGRDEIRRALRGYAGPDYVPPAFRYAPWAELAQLLCEQAPGDLSKVFRCTGGSEAVDISLQIAAVFTGRKKFLSIENAYHGNTIGTISVGATASRKILPAVLSGCGKLKTPLDEKRLKQVEKALRKKDVASFIMEPVPTNLGVEIHDERFMRGLQELCSRYGTLLIADEVACGFGRTGKLFACEHFGLQPDVLCLGKAMSGGYGGIGAVLTSNEVYQKIKEDISPYSTYGWHPLAVQATLANIRYMVNHKETLLWNVEERSQQLRTALSGMNFKKGGELRIIGLAVAVDLEDESYASKVKTDCQKEGLLFTVSGSRIVLFPPLTVDEDVVDRAIGVLERNI